MKRLSEFKDDDILAFIGHVNGYTYIVQRKYRSFNVYGNNCFKKAVRLPTSRDFQSRLCNPYFTNELFRKATKEEIEEYNKLINQKDEDSDRYNIL